jgi:hypothetical protein
MMAESCVVSKPFLESVKQRALAEGRAAADEALKQRRTSNNKASTSASEGLTLFTAVLTSCFDALQDGS